jgi:hypothetical protein
LADVDYEMLAPRERAHVLLALRYFRLALEAASDHMHDGILAAFLSGETNHSIPSGTFGDALTDFAQARRMLTGREATVLRAVLDDVLADG